MAMIALQISRLYRVMLVLLSVGFLVFLYATYANNGSLQFSLQLITDDPTISSSSNIFSIGKIMNISLNPISVDGRPWRKDSLLHIAGNYRCHIYNNQRKMKIIMITLLDSESIHLCIQFDYINILYRCIYKWSR